MKRRRKIVAGGVIALAVIGVGAVLAWRAVTSQLSRDAPSHPVVQVQRAFREARESTGHLTHLEAGIRCTDCHQTGEERGAAGASSRPDSAGPGRPLLRMSRPAAAVCVRCHTSPDVTVHESPQAASAAECFTCHDFAGDRNVKPWGCVRCHANPEATLATQIELHADVTCAACHAPHDRPSLRPPDCATCHPDVATRHGPKGIEGARRCLDCHSAHDTREAADRRCATCHRGETQAPQIPLTATFAGHDKCVNCHAPHEFTRKDARACSSCHEDKIPVAKHTACSTCHDEHAPRATAETCVRCHRSVERPPEGHTCLGCHPPHGGGSGFLSLSGTPDDLSATVSLTTENCATCHLETRHAPETECASCHTPHKPTPAEDKRLCVRCHQTQVAQTARTHVTPGALVPGHRNCRVCHADPAHRPQLARPACITCHAQEGITAPPGHSDCSRCHNTHDGAIRPEATCASCHEDRKQGHGTLAKAKLPGGCASCHRPHGGAAPGPSSPPACATCHDTAELPGLHAVDKHQLCATCHTAHEAAPRADRRTCTGTCHTDQRAHEPTATSCVACHPFRRGRKAP